MQCRIAFRTEELIYIPTGKMGSWMNINLCVWNGPQCLRHTPCLEDFYPEHHEFFRHTLEVPDVTWKTMMQEAEHIELTDSPEYISQVFTILNKHVETEIDVPTQTLRKPGILKGSLAKRPSHAELETIGQTAIFPIQTKDSNFTFDTFRYLSPAHGREMWLIADRWHLRQSFEGLIPLLALPVATVGKISHLIKVLNLDNRLLSNVAQGIPTIRGLSKTCPQQTLSLRAKSRSIAR